MAEHAGRQLGQYTLLEVIGQGGMATVYRARQESMGRDVAVKVLPHELAGDPDFSARFRREAQVIAHLQHPHILPVYDFGEEDDLAYLVMRLVSGGTLADELREGPLSLSQANRLLTQIAAALNHAHGQGVIHRDLKPENVLLDDDDNAYLTDFGIAKMLAGTTTFTQTGHLMGTPIYMAPEQWRSMPVDARTDVYALGMILYEMLVGLQPFEADTPYALMFDHLDKLPPSPVRYHPNLPAAVEAVILKAIAKEPDDRYSSAGDMAAEFAAIVAEAPSPDYRPPRPKRRFPSIELGAYRSYDESTFRLPGRRQPAPEAAPPPVPEGDLPETAEQRAAPPTREHASGGPPSGPDSIVLPPAPRRGRSAGLLVILVAGALLGVIIAGAWFIFAGGEEAAPAAASPTATAPTPAPAETATGSALVVLPSASPVPSRTPTGAAPVIIIQTDTATATASASPTAAPSRTPTGAAPVIIIQTDTPRPSDTATLTASASPTIAPSRTPTGAAPVIIIQTDTPHPSDTATATVTASASPTIAPSRTPTGAAPVIIIQTDTPRPSDTATVMASASPTTAPSRTPTGAAPVIIIQTDTPRPSDTATATASLTSSPTPSPTPRPTLTPSPTPDLAATAEFLVEQRLTQTAESWTDTPTPTLTPTITPTPTPTASPTATDSPTPTLTVTPSITPLPTLPPPPTATYTATAAPTLTPLPPLPSATTSRTATHTPTATSAAPTLPPTPTALVLVTLPATITPMPTTRPVCAATVAANVAVNVRAGPGIGFEVVDRFLPGERRPALLHTDTGWVYVGAGWVDDTLVRLAADAACAALPRITARDSSAGAVCTGRSRLAFNDMRLAADPISERFYIINEGVPLAIFRVVTGSDGQRWFYVATEGTPWRFGWMPEEHVIEDTPCPAPETESITVLPDTAPPVSTSPPAITPGATGCAVATAADNPITIHVGPGVGFTSAGRLLPHDERLAWFRTDTGWVYIDAGWLDDQYVRFTPADACAALPEISARDSSAAAVCTIVAVRAPSDLRIEPNPIANRAYVVNDGVTLSVFRVVVGADGQRWFFAATNDANWWFGWMPEAHAEELSACPPPES